MFPSHSDRCWRCGGEEGCLIHLFWSCPLIKPFWDQIKLYLPKFTDRLIPDEQAIFLLHHNSFSANSYWISLLHLLNVAWSYVAEFWKQMAPPPLAKWVLSVNEIMRMEELVTADMSSFEKFRNCWF